MDASDLDISTGLNLRDSLLNTPSVEELNNLLVQLPVITCGEEAQHLRSSLGDINSCALPTFQIFDIENFEPPRTSHFDPDELKFLERIQVKQQKRHESNRCQQIDAPYSKRKRELSDLTPRHKIEPVDSPQSA